MTVNELLETLRQLKAEGHGDCKVMMLDPIRGYDYYFGHPSYEPLTTVESCFIERNARDGAFIKLLF